MLWKRGELKLRADVTFRALVDGDRVLPFGLLQELRVSRVSLVGTGIELDYIQEHENKDGAFYVVMAEPLIKGESYHLRIECEGDDVLDDAGGGNYSVGARSNWYPNLNPFSDRATFELIFTYPRKFELASTGNLEESNA